MVWVERSSLRAVEVVLAVLALLVATLVATDFRPYPSWPTLAGVPVDPELAVPGLLGVVAVGRALRDGLGVGSVVVGILGVVTAALATMGLHTLYTATSGCAFAGGLFTLAAGVPLAIVVLARNAARELFRRGFADAVGDRFGNS